MAELSLFDYVPTGLAIFGNPGNLLRAAAQSTKASLERVMFTASPASGPLATLEFFGGEALPALD